MPRADDRERSAPETHDERHDDRLNQSGGHRYQQAHRAPGSTQDGDAATAGTRSAVARETAEPDQQQRADEHGGPSPDDEARLARQGYPKLGKKLQSRVTQVEHGPYAGGTQQGDARTRERREQEGAEQAR